MMRMKTPVCDAAEERNFLFIAHVPDRRLERSGLPCEHIYTVVVEHSLAHFSFARIPFGFSILALRCLHPVTSTEPVTCIF